MLKPGLVSITFRKLSPRIVASLVSSAGLEAIEWGGDVHVPHGDLTKAKEVRSITEEFGLEVSSYGSYYRAGESEKAGLGFEQVLASAIELKAPVIRVWAGSKDRCDADASYVKAVADDLARIAGMAAAHGISVSMEFHGGTVNNGVDGALELFGMLDGANVMTHWQPPNGMPSQQCLEGLTKLLPKISILHVFSWTFLNGGMERHPLADGSAIWNEYIKTALSSISAKYALLEFVKDDSPEQFLQDAATLKSLLQGAASQEPIRCGI